eukprot:7474976-Karenia_brevis.AAC.1
MEGSRTFLYLILRGGIQGCPLSGWIFSAILDPVLNLLQQTVTIPTQSYLLGCADDLAGIISCFHVLEFLA